MIICRSGMLLAGLALWACLAAGPALAVSGGNPDVTGRFGFVALLEITSGSETTLCSASALDDHTLLTAAHCIPARQALSNTSCRTGDNASRGACLLPKRSKAGSLSITIKSARDGLGSVPASKALVNRAFLTADLRSGRSDFSQHDLAIIKTDVPLREFLPSLFFVDIPQTGKARDDDGNINPAMIRASFDEGEVLGLLENVATVQGWPSLNAFVAGFGYVNCFSGTNCANGNHLDEERWWIEKQVETGARGGWRCAGGDARRTARASVLCAAASVETTVDPSDRPRGMMHGDIRPDATIYDAQQGDSGGPLAVQLQHGTGFSVLGSEDVFLVLGVTSSGRNGVGLYTGLLANTGFLLDALEGSGDSYSTLPLERKSPPVVGRSPIDGLWELGKRDGHILPDKQYVGFYEYVVSSQIGCDKREHLFSVEADRIVVKPNLFRSFQVCARDVGDEAVAEEQFYRELLSAREITFTDDAINLRMGDGRTLELLRSY